VTFSFVTLVLPVSIFALVKICMCFSPPSYFRWPVTQQRHGGKGRLLWISTKPKWQWL